MKEKGMMKNFVELRMKKEEAGFVCDWGHDPLTCQVCLRWCTPYGACTHHGHKR